MAMNETFVAAVNSGKTIWRKADFDAIGISKEMKKEAGIVDCPRWNGWKQGTGDGVHLDVNGIHVICYGTSNMTSNEKRYYYDHKGSGTGTPRATATVANTANRDMAKKLLATFEAGSVTKEQQLMLLQLAGASEVARNLFNTFETCSIEQLEMLMSM